MALNWIYHTAHEPMPVDAVRAGHDCDGAPIYVGRATHVGCMLPAKVVPDKGGAYVCSDGREHKKNSYEVLVGHGYAWAPASNGFVPPNAVMGGGNSESGEQLYIGRVLHSNSLCVGKVHSSEGSIYIPYDGLEIKLPTYEVLVYH